jgi:hypothetical protein
MSTKTKGRNGGDRAPLDTTDARSHTGTETPSEWLNLAKSSRINRQQKRRWQRGARK